jgi:hypothetical protein
MAARALFAFQIGECEDDEQRSYPSADALLGAVLLSEARGVLLNFAENFVSFAEAWAKQQKARGRRPRRR